MAKVVKGMTKDGRVVPMGTAGVLYRICNDGMEEVVTSGVVKAYERSGESETTNRKK